jgi:hypothetical protein|tara:strand:- start:1759 stop:2127 length:369 start_codon:yes stop_codon:yes gene_type:complete
MDKKVIVSCHCGSVELELLLPNGFELRRCNCSICRRKGAIVGSVLINNLKILKGEDFLSLYQFNTNTAKHFFCSACGIYTHHQRRSNPQEFSFNTGCVEGFNAEDYPEPEIIDGINHIKDRS